MTGRGRTCGGAAAPQSRKERTMKRVFEYLNTHQAAVLWFSLALMVSSSAFALLEAFSHQA
jgi:hypothetical protein